MKVSIFGRLDFQEFAKLLNGQYDGKDIQFRHEKHQTVTISKGSPSFDDSNICIEYCQDPSSPNEGQTIIGAECSVSKDVFIDWDADYYNKKEIGHNSKRIEIYANTSDELYKHIAIVLLKVLS